MFRFTIFDPVKSKKTIGRKELTAVLLLIAILLIHIVKVFHTHPLPGFSDHHATTVVLQKADDCLICDYQFTKDTYYSIPLSAITAQPVSTVFSMFYSSRTPSSTGLNYTNKGPPAFA